MELKVGQVWEDCDIRTPDGKTRRVRITYLFSLGGVDYAYVENEALHGRFKGAGRRTRIRADRLYCGGARGYKLVEDV